MAEKTLGYVVVKKGERIGEGTRGDHVSAPELGDKARLHPTISGAAVELVKTSPFAAAKYTIARVTELEEK
jgi:hypothetical protein